MKFSSRVVKTFEFLLVLRTRENTDVFIALDDNICGVHGKRVNILYISRWTRNVDSTLCLRCVPAGIWSTLSRCLRL